MLALRIDVDTADAQAYFEFAGQYARDQRGPLQRTLTDIRQVAAVAFQTETAPDGSGWQELSPFTIKNKGHDRILVETGLLQRKAITGGSVTRDRLVYDPTRMKEGHDLAEIHMRGQRLTHTNSKGESFATVTPARRWFQWTPQLRMKLEVHYMVWLEELRSRNARRRNAPRPVMPEAPTATYVFPGGASIR